MPAPSVDDLFAWLGVSTCNWPFDHGLQLTIGRQHNSLADTGFAAMQKLGI